MSQVCTNCGAKDHNQKFCYEKPKKVAQIKRDAKIIKDALKQETIVNQQILTTQISKIAKSKYTENNYFGQHTQVWGSYWNEVLGWGFACCYSNQKTEECMGEKGKRQSLTKEYLIKRQIEETPLVEQALKSGPVNLAELYRESNLREGPPVDLIIGPKTEDQQ